MIWLILFYSVMMGEVILLVTQMKIRTMISSRAIKAIVRLGTKLLMRVSKTVDLIGLIRSVMMDLSNTSIRVYYCVSLGLETKSVPSAGIKSTFSSLRM